MLALALRKFGKDQEANEMENPSIIPVQTEF